MAVGTPWKTRGVSTQPPRRVVRPRQTSQRALWLGVVALILAWFALLWSVATFAVASAYDHSASDQVLQDLKIGWIDGDDPLSDPVGLSEGTAVAFVTLPHLTGHNEFPLLTGTSPAVLATGFGWYDQTAAPGAVGNCGIVALGSRNTPLADLRSMEVGDPVWVETATHVYTYEVSTAPMRVPAADTWVLQPVPGQPEVAPTEAILTLTTAQGGPLKTNARSSGPP